MKKICFLIADINHSGGTERVTTLIANSLAEQENHVFILSLSRGDQPFFELNSKINVQSIFEEKISMRKNFFEAVKRIRHFLVSNNIDTLIVVDSISCVFTVPACRGLKLNHICWEHFNLKVNLGSRFRDLGRWMAARWCHKIITLTERDKSFWDEKYNLASVQKVFAIPNPSPYELQDNYPNLESKTVLCVGRLTPQKGFDYLVDAWSKMASHVPDWKVIIVGCGEDENKLKDLAKEKGVDTSIIFAGQQKNMDQFYRKASFFCMSSRFEGLPMVLLEAQSYGLPIVSFDCDTGPAEIIHDENNGYLVECFNTDLLAKSLERMINKNQNEFENMVNFSFNNSKNFEIDQISIKWKKLLDNHRER